ncbi:hypothetical protein VII00023_01855 [Vibrio ichthyoenteri ATCC 700023]|uniref:Uncharacterized protein n=1 Tax=Vibrio ichthyoenteri ATCC 700023 TaxID=870968 RepID=F9S2Z7_9VIBR|nr:hypothetical protein [Vibrio ichthyoenteri]EGU38625.1 hypothetical protein VII00023_01855 [Vibrio ichthyoenteri ATCC 700023]
MVRKILVSLAFLGIASGMVQLVLIAFYDTLDGGMLAGWSIALGLGLAALIYYFVFDAADIGYTLISVNIGLLIATFTVKWIDNSYAPQQIITIDFEVVAIGSSQVKSTEFVYLQLRSSHGNIKYTVDDDQLGQFSIGDILHLDAEMGYFGYPTVQ